VSAEKRLAYWRGKKKHRNDRESRSAKIRQCTVKKSPGIESLRKKNDDEQIEMRSSCLPTLKRGGRGVSEDFE